ncbi:MAG: transporter [Alphaproteobacteria bacterium]|nr:transporter [Alphaproteobacteria bacterium]
MAKNHPVAMAVVAACGLVVLMASAAAAEDVRHPLGWRAAPLDGPLVADRPGFTIAPDPVARGRLQLEGGYQFTRDRNGQSSRTHTLPILMLRTGIADNLEVQIGWTGSIWTRVDGERPHDFSDLTVGIKTRLLDQSGIVPAIGVSGMLSIPSGSSGATSGDVDPSLAFNWSYSFDGGYGIGGTARFDAVNNGGDRSDQGGASLIGTVPLFGPVSVYAEYFVLVSETIGPRHVANGGFIWLVNDNLQLDVNAGAGLNERAEDYFVGAGFVFRL